MTLHAVIVVGDELDSERVIADLLALPGPIRVYVQNNPAEPTIASRVYPSETIAGLGPIEIERVVFADEPMRDQIALWPDLVLAYPSPPGKRSLTWAVVAHAVNLGRICAVWMPWLSVQGLACPGSFHHPAARRFVPPPRTGLGHRRVERPSRDPA